MWHALLAKEGYGLQADFGRGLWRQGGVSRAREGKCCMRLLFLDAHTFAGLCLKSVYYLHVIEGEWPCNEWLSVKTMSDPVICMVL